MTKNQKLLLWVGLGAAALIVLGRNQASAAAGGGYGQQPGGGYMPPGGSPGTPYNYIEQLLQGAGGAPVIGSPANFSPAGTPTYSPTPETA